MKYLLMVIVAVSLFDACGQNSTLNTNASLASADIKSIRNFLSDYSKRIDELQEFYEPEHSLTRKKAIAYFLTISNQIPIEQKIVIAACMGKENDFKGATVLLEEYVQVFTNVARGWAMLGACYGMLDQYEKSIGPYEKAVALGDDASIPSLCGLALHVGRMDVIKKHLSDLMRLKRRGILPERVKGNVIGILISYAVETNDEDMFIRTTEDMNLDSDLLRDNVRSAIDVACKRFNSPKAKEICQKISEAVEKTKARN